MAVDDKELLKEFVLRKSDQAFGQIVHRYADLIYASALRQVREADLAQEVAQAAFIVLARRASSVQAEHLPGWLLGTARLCAEDGLKKQARRSHHDHCRNHEAHSVTTRLTG